MPGATGYEHEFEEGIHLPNHDLVEYYTTFYTPSSRIHSETASASCSLERLKTVAYSHESSLDFSHQCYLSVLCVLHNIFFYSYRDSCHIPTLPTAFLNIRLKSFRNLYDSFVNYTDLVLSKLIKGLI